MFNIGGGEFIVIAVLALIVLGPQRLPDAARQVGKVMSDLRRVSTGFQRELEGALEDVDPAARAAVTRHVIGRVGGSSPLGKGLSSAVAAVSAQGTPPADPAEASSDGSAAPAAAARKAPAAKKAKAPAKKAPAKGKAPAKKAATTAKKAPAKKAAPKKRTGG
jgi:Tat protein translocase TatB subunit